MRYSQNNEEDAVIDYFKCNCGTFLDIGAMGGDEYSNTRQLAEMGWSGVMVEPDARNFEHLAKAVSHLWNIVLIRAAVAAQRGRAQLYIEKDRLYASTLSMACVKKHDMQVIASPVVPVIEPDDLRLLGLPFDFISIDAEHMDMEIFQAGDKIFFGCKLICVEKAGLDWPPVLAAKGFTKLILDTPENLIYARP